MWARNVGRNWRMLLIGSIILLSGMYFVMDGQLFGYIGNQPSIGTSVNGVHSGSGAPTSQRSEAGPEDPSPTTINTLMQSMQGVAGLDEVVVLPTTSGDGYTVSADVNLGSAAPGTSGLAQKIEKETGQFFISLFTSGQNVVNGELYFTTDGQIVASAGLGDHAYQALATKTGTGSTSLAQTLSEQPTIMQQGANNSWFEMNITG